MKKNAGKRRATIADVDMRVEKLAIMTAHGLDLVEKRFVDMETGMTALKDDMKRVVEVVERIDMRLSVYAG